MIANRSDTSRVTFSTKFAFGILLILVLIWISIHIGLSSIYSSLSLRYLMMVLLLCISILLIKVLIRVRRGGASILALLLLAFAVKYQFYINFSYAYDRDNPTLLGTVERMIEYSSIPPDSALSAYQQFYYKHPGLILTSSIIYIVTGFTRIEMLVVLFLVIFILSYLFIFIYISNYYDYLTSLLSMLLILFMSGYMAYAVFSRGTISFIFMFTFLILLNHAFREMKISHFVSILVILLSLTITHDLTTTILASMIVIMGVAYSIIGFAEKNNEFKVRNSALFSLILITTSTLIAYDIYRSHLIFEHYLPRILNLEESQIRPLVIFRERTLREWLSLISRTMFWFLAGITVLIHILHHMFKRKRCPRGVYDLSFGIVSGALIITSITIGFLPPRLWIYAYILLIPLTIHALSSSFDDRSNSKKVKYLSILEVALVISYLISQLSSLSSFTLTPFEYHRQEYETGDYRYKWSLREIKGVDWFYSKLDQDKDYTIVGDLAVSLIASRYPIRIASSLNDIRSAIEGIIGREKNIIILYRAEMEYILRGYDDFALSNNVTSKRLDRYYSKLYVNGEISLYYSRG